MQFTSLYFAAFLIPVFALYWMLNKHGKIQNLILLLASYTFYAYWNWRYLSLLFSISMFSYVSGLLIYKTKTPSMKRALLLSSIIVCITTLSYFKYFAFFINTCADLLSQLNYTLPKPASSLLMPLGMSIYIFLSLSYIIDVYHDKLPAERNAINVLLSLSFFPIIFSGPIQKPITLLPQVCNNRVFDLTLAREGLRQILWGLFMKTVIADNCAVLANQIFHNYPSYSGSTLLLGAVYYSIQVYSDFAGYSEIAIGVSKLFGFKLMQNFSNPYFSRDMTEFWRTWHISLTSWFREYIFLPMAYSISRHCPGEKVLFMKSELLIYIIGISVTWLLTGLWHGGNYTFVVWGLTHGGILVLYRVLKKPRQKLFRRWNIDNSGLPVRCVERAVTLCTIIVTWIVFRANDLGAAAGYLRRMLSPSLFSRPAVPSGALPFLIIFFFMIEWIQKDKTCAMDIDCAVTSKPLRWSLYYGLIFMIVWFAGSRQQFIYFQF